MLWGFSDSDFAEFYLQKEYHALSLTRQRTAPPIAQAEEPVFSVGSEVPARHGGLPDVGGDEFGLGGGVADDAGVESPPQRGSQVSGPGRRRPPAWKRRRRISTINRSRTASRGIDKRWATRQETSLVKHDSTQTGRISKDVH